VTTIPISPDLEFQSFSVRLDGVDFTLEVRWNARAAAWMLTVGDAVGRVLLAGRRVVVGFPLLGRFADARLPPGELLAIDTADSDVEAQLGELGRRVELVYVTAAELAA
jgi:hypothetical protein